jgi:hypothetical protein
MLLDFGSMIGGKIQILPEYFFIRRVLAAGFL